MLLVSAQALATDVANQTASLAQDAVVSVAPQVPSTQDQLIQVTLGLAAVVACIYLVAWLIKKNQNLSGVSNEAMKTLAVLPLGVKEKIILIEVGEQQLLLGVTPESINTLATFDEPILKEKPNAQQSFSNKLKDILAQAQSKQNQTNSKDHKE